MTPDTQSLIDQLRDQMAGMKKADKIEVLCQIVDGYWEWDMRATKNSGVTAITLKWK